MTVDDVNVETSSLFGSDMIFDKLKHHLGNDEQSAWRDINRFYRLNFPVAAEILQCNSVTLKGTKYIRGKKQPIAYWIRPK